MFRVQGFRGLGVWGFRGLGVWSSIEGFYTGSLQGLCKGFSEKQECVLSGRIRGFSMGLQGAIGFSRRFGKGSKRL